MSATQPDLTLEYLAIISQPLKDERVPDAHGTQLEQEQVSSEQLMQWGVAEGHGEEEVQQLLSMAQLYSQPNRPLVRNPSWPTSHLSSQ